MIISSLLASCSARREYSLILLALLTPPHKFHLRWWGVGRQLWWCYPQSSVFLTTQGLLMHKHVQPWKGRKVKTPGAELRLMWCRNKWIKSPLFSIPYRLVTHNLYVILRSMIPEIRWWVTLVAEDSLLINLVMKHPFFLALFFLFFNHRTTLSSKTILIHSTSMIIFSGEPRLNESISNQSTTS